MDSLDKDIAGLARHRLMQGEQFDATVVDLDVKLVDVGVSPEDPIDDGEVALDDALDRQLQAIFRKAAHLEQPPLQFVEFILKVPGVSFHDGMPAD